MHNITNILINFLCQLVKKPHIKKFIDDRGFKDREFHKYLLITIIKILN